MRDHISGQDIDSKYALALRTDWDNSEQELCRLLAANQAEDRMLYDRALSHVVGQSLNEAFGLLHAFLSAHGAGHFDAGEHALSPRQAICLSERDAVLGHHVQSAFRERLGERIDPSGHGRLASFGVHKGRRLLCREIGSRTDAHLGENVEGGRRERGIVLLDAGLGAEHIVPLQVSTWLCATSTAAVTPAKATQ